MTATLSVTWTSSEAYSRRSARFRSRLASVVGRTSGVNRTLHAVRESRLDVEVAARDVERVVPVRFVQLGGVLQERDDAEGHGGKVRRRPVWPRAFSGPGPAPATRQAQTPTNDVRREVDSSLLHRE